MGVPGAERYVVADHHHRHTGGGQGVQYGGEALLELRVQPLGRLVQQQDVRLVQQHLAESRPLLLAAGQVVGVPVQQLRQPAQAHRLLHPMLPLIGRYLHAVEGLVEILPHGLFYE